MNSCRDPRITSKSWPQNLKQVIVGPVVLGDRIVNLIYLHSVSGKPLPLGEDELVRVCTATAAAYRRVIQARQGKA